MCAFAVKRFYAGLFFASALLYYGCSETQTTAFRSPAAPETIESRPDLQRVLTSADERRQVDLGASPQGQPLEHTFHVRNSTESAFEILDIQKSCGCEAVDLYIGQIVAKGEFLSADYRVPTPIAGTKSAVLTIRTDATDENLAEITLTLNAQVVPRLRAEPEQILFDETVSSTASIPLTVFLATDEDKTESLTVRSARGAAAAQRVTAASGEVRFNVSPSDQANHSIRTDYLIFTLNSSEPTEIVVPVAFRLSTENKPRHRIASTLNAVQHAGTSTAAAVQPDGKPHSPDFSNGSEVVLLAQAEESTGSGESPDAAAILLNTREVMSLPTQYRLFFGKVKESSYFVQQKRLADGSLASRVEFFMIAYDKVNLSLPEKSYDLYPLPRIAIDNQIRPVPMRKEAEQIASTIERAIDGSDRQTATLLGTQLVDGVECYEIETSVPEEIRELGQLISRSQLSTARARFRFLINKVNGVLVELQSFSVTGDIIDDLSFAEVVVHPNLSDDLFTVPADYELLNVQTRDEDRTAARRVADKHYSLIMSELPLENRSTPNVLGDIRKEYQEAAKQQIEELKQEILNRPRPSPQEVSAPQSPPQSLDRTGRYLLITLNVLVLVLILVIAFRRGK